MSQKVDWSKLTEEEKVALRQKNNPYNLATGHYTGRCKRCGSSDMWADVTAYGCNVCDAFYVTG